MSVPMPPMKNTAPQMMAVETWIHSQYECSAGTSWSLEV